MIFQKKGIWDSPRKSNTNLFFGLQAWTAFCNRWHKLKIHRFLKTLAETGFCQNRIKTDFDFTENNFDLTWFQNWKTGFETRTEEKQFLVYEKGSVKFL